ncbi:MAG: hypothetical protein ABSG46_13580 [Candidatus Binataceae bacterium]|jgi:hypothetical protein
MNDKPGGTLTATGWSSGSANPRLHERITAGLMGAYPDALIEPGVDKFRADMVIRSGSRVAMIEIKTGDPESPLPSSANVQMLILKDRIQRQFMDVVPVLITNYRLDESDYEEMSASGIKVIDIEGSVYDSKAVANKLNAILSDADPSLAK